MRNIEKMQFPIFVGGFLFFFYLVMVRPVNQVLNSYKNNNYRLDYLQSGVNFNTDVFGTSTLPNLSAFGMYRVDSDTITSADGTPPSFNTTTNSSELSQDATTQLCKTNGLYLGLKDSFVDCSLKCNTTGVDYRYIEKDVNVVIEGVKLSRGAYCLPSEYLRCNPAISNLIYGNGKWECIPKYSIFGGIGGNQIIKCNGKLRDNERGTVYEDLVHSHFAVKNNDLDSKQLIDGKLSYIYTCDHASQKDHRGNSLIYSRLDDRFDLIPNYCARKMYNVPYDPQLPDDEQIMPNFETGKCNCPRVGTVSFAKNPSDTECITCATGMGTAGPLVPGGKFTYGRAVSCLQQDSLISDIGPDNLLPCGTTTQMSVQPDCVTAAVFLTNSASPAFMQAATVA